MIAGDAMRFAFDALREHRLRSALSILGITIAIAAVTVLTAVGEGAQRFIVGEFTQFGTNVLAINPGKTETVGIPGMLGGSTRKLTIEDAEALRRIRGVRDVLPVVTGQGRVESGARGRSVYVLGVTSEAPEIFKLSVERGTFLPASDPRRGGAHAVLGASLARELFPSENPLGQWVHIAGQRLRVRGVMASKGQLLGFDMDDLAWVPLATAMRLFNQSELMEIDVTFGHEDMTDRIVRSVTAILKERHGGNEDFTITTQGAMLEVFDQVLSKVTWTVTAIAAISLLVGAVGVLTMMWISVGERTHEIGLLRAIGATPGQVQRLFLVEAIAIATLGGALGLLCGWSLAFGLRILVPAVPAHLVPTYGLLAVAVSAGTGLLAGFAPARRAARLPPVEALRAE